MSAYFIANVGIRNSAEYQKYVAQVPDLIKPHGGRFLVRGGPVKFSEGDWGPGRWVVLEFPNMDSLERWYNSEDYQRVLQIRKNSATSNAVAVEGV